MLIKRSSAAEMNSEWRRPVAGPCEENKICTGSYLVTRTVWAVFGWGKSGRRNRHKWSNYFGMRSLFGSISSRLWPRETQPSSKTGCVISSLHPPQWTRTFFCEFGRGTFCPQVGYVINHPRYRPVTVSSNRKFISGVSVEGSMRCMYLLNTAP